MADGGQPSNLMSDQPPRNEDSLPLGSVAPSSQLSVKKFIAKVERQFVTTSAS